ncbi:sugar ABC transporter ATP-binding protein [Leucobacter sp. CSA1]|uniref:Sugar ABC transporter ATP-binding protein n=1 Tax=Leucobacter chromiisoli TaxID=2796471 RepID=A0A934Q4S3_9MICO|nr:sugar ABC transporter ATP-binding protein [Leucobacter chromiisoli]MBK0418410.1 sugar ABC transporter ATP-binding protein [Leucobacter chromiisoli]
METARPASALRMVDIDKSFPGVRALDGAGLDVAAGEVHGLVGENGAGKSTIIKVLAGVYTPDAGSVEIGGERVPVLTPQAVHERGVRFIHQELHLVPHFTVAESVFMGHELQGRLGLRKREMRDRAARILEEQLGLALDPGALIRDISPAQKKLVQIARALTDDDIRLIVFDEPTAPLAATEVDQVLGAVRRLRDAGVASLYVSHYLGEITELCDRVTVFRNGSDVGRIDEPGPDSAREMIRLMTGKEAGQLFPERARPTDREVLSVSGLTDGSAFAGVDLSIRAGEVLGVAGLLGSGTEELVDCLVGLRRARGGELRVEGRARRFRSPADALRQGVVLIPRDRRHDGLVLDLPVQDNVNLSTLDDASVLGAMLSGRRIAERAKRMVAALDVRPADPERKVRLLSGGNQQKVVIARSLLTEARIIILDEPTVGVDIGAKAEIYRLVASLAEQGAAVLVSSNDPIELLGLCHRVEVMVRGRIVGTHDSESLTRDSLLEAMTASTAAAEGAHA